MYEKRRYRDIMEKPKICNACESFSIAYLKKNDAGLNEWKCSGCGLVFVWPVPSQEYLLKYYNESEHLIEYAKEKDIEPPNASHRMIISFARQPKKKMKIMDVGAGNGSLLEYYKQIGHDVYAYEYSSLSAEFLEKHSISCFQGKFSSGLFSEASPFDMILMTEVLEHVDDPTRYLQEIFRMLLDGGQLCLSVPNRDFLLKKSYWASFKNTPHLSHFTQKSLQIMLEKVGFSDVVFHLATHDTYNHTMPIKRLAMLAAIPVAIAINRITNGNSNLGFQLFVSAKKPNKS